MGKGSYIGGHTIIVPKKNKFGKKQKLEKIKEKKFLNFEEELFYFVRRCAILKGKRNEYPFIPQNISEFLEKKGASLEEYLNKSDEYKRIYEINKKLRLEQKKVISERKQKENNLNKIINKKKKLQR